MSKRKADYRKPLDDKMAEALLATYGQGQDIPVSEYLRRTRHELLAAVLMARETLTTNVLTDVVAKEASRNINRRGGASLEVGDDGVVYLVVTYGQSGGEDTRRWSSSLPLIEVLRETAEGLGIDPMPFGRRKRDLAKAIENARKAAEVPTKVKGKMFRTGQAISPITVVQIPKAESTESP